jgi:hypothetical protein
MVLVINDMAEKYGMLPSEVLEKATTHDLMIYNNANMIALRDQKKAKGESISDTISQTELNQIWENTKGKDGS